MTQASAPRSLKWIAAALVATIALTAADLWTKDWAIHSLSVEPHGGPPPICAGRGLQRLPTGPVVLFDDYLELSYAENCGAAFGLLRDASETIRHGVFGVAGVLATIILFYLFARGKGGVAFAASVPFIVSGAIGNLHDRVRYGYVVDFIRAHWQNRVEWPTFNIADAAITIGIGLMVVDSFLEARREKLAQAEVPATADAGSKAKPSRQAKSS